MDKRFFTTGEAAELCGVSVRTVQYYDREEIVKPTQLSEGGRRIYSEADISKFQLVCLYKGLGFSLKEIKTILDSDDEYKTILELLDKQRSKLDEQIEQMVTLKNRLDFLHEEILAKKTLPIITNEELSVLLVKKEKHKKVDSITNILLIGFVTLVLLGFFMAEMLGGVYVFIMIGITVIMLFGLIGYHSANNAYLCPYCKNKFKISFFRDMFSLNGGKRGKYLKCPNCHRKNWIAETYKDD